jgi:hypothetical protein
VPGQRPAGETAGANGSGSGSSGGLSLPVNGTALKVLLLIVVALVVAIGVPLLQTTLRRRRRGQHSGDPREVAVVAWQETMRDAYDLGFPTSPAESPRQTARRLVDSAALSVTASEAMHRLARAVERARYAPVAADPQGLLRDAEVVGAALFAAAPRRAKLRARTLPPSMTAALAETVSLWSNAVARRTSRVLDRLVAVGNRALHRRPA